MLRKLLSTGLFMFAFVSFAMAQTGSIEGTVTDSKTGDTVPAANVLLKEINSGAATNAQGAYTISDVPVGTYTMRVTYVGYKAYETKVTISANQTLEKDVKLKPSSVGLDEVVVTGYGGAQDKREITGSISSVSSDEIEEVPTDNAAGLLQGRAPGVQVSSTSGNPGGGFDVQVRGQGSINADNRPLYIVDGVQLSNSNNAGQADTDPLNGVDPSNIQSIEVLKDASAAAIYGAQAANGVVLITTKDGTAGDTQVSASVTRGVSSYIENIDYMNRDQFNEYFIRAAQNVNGLSRSQAKPFVRNTLFPAFFSTDPSKKLGELPDTDWMDFVTRKGVMQKYQASVSGGNESTTFRLSGHYKENEGQFRSSNNKSFGFSAKLNHQVSDKFSVNSKLDLSKNSYDATCQDGFYVNCPVASALFQRPVVTPYKDKAETQYTSQGLIGGRGGNPALIFNETTRTTNTIQILGNVSADYELASWLTLRGQFGLDYRNVRNDGQFTPTAAPSDGGTVNENYNETTNFTTNVRLNFDKTFADAHNVSGFVGAEYRRDFTRSLSAAGKNVPNGSFTVIDATAEPTSVGSYTDEFRQAGYFANAKYNYDQRYYISLTGRYDGSSRFGKNERWGFFPSASVGWEIAEEDFFNADFVESLKLKAGYGVVGNSNVGRYAARGLYSLSGTYGGAAALSPSQIGNSNLTWEEAHEINVGVDYSLFSNRISGSINVYRRNNKQLLLDNPLPQTSGYGSITENVGEVRNEGIEFSLSTVNVAAGDFQWSTSFNISVKRNEVIALSGDKEALDPGAINPVRKGHSIQAYNITEYAGVNPADGRPMWYDKNGNLTYKFGQSDRKFYDGGEEDVLGGFGNTLNYKGFSLDVFFQYSFGKTATPQQVFFFGQSQVGSSLSNGREAVVEDSWQKPGDVVNIPYPYYSTSGSATYPGTDSYATTASSAAFYDASYIRLKNATLSYTLPQSITDKISLSNVRVFVRGLNLVTWTSYIGLDPEAAGNATQASYPVARRINGGIEVKF